MIRFLTLFICMPFFVFGNNEKLISGIVTDSLNNGIAYVSVGIPGTEFGIVTRINGTFELLIKENDLGEKDTVRFSMIGFNPMTVSLTEIKSCEDSIFHITMKIAPVILRDVEVSMPGLIRKTYGNHNIHARMSNNMAISKQPSQNLGAEVGRKFHLKGKRLFLDKVNFYIKYCNFDTVVFRIKIYQSTHNMPGELLVDENILMHIYNHRKGWVQFDLSPYHITVDKNVIVALEWVDHSVKGSLLGFPITVPSVGAVHYYKFGSQNKWKTFFSMSTAMNIEVLEEP